MAKAGKDNSSTSQNTNMGQSHPPPRAVSAVPADSNSEYDFTPSHEFGSLRAIWKDQVQYVSDSSAKLLPHYAAILMPTQPAHPSLIILGLF